MTPASHQKLPIATWNIPLVGGGEKPIEALPGRVITVVGANGAGKSALVTWMAGQIPEGKRRRVLAQRRVWFSNSGPDISASGREYFAESTLHWDSSFDSRYLDHADGQRTDVALFDLIGKIAAEHHRIADLSQRERRSPDEIEQLVGPRLFEVLNSTLEQAGLVVRVTTTERQSFSAVHRASGNEYPIAQMSDGERNALLLAAEVLVAPDQSVILLDEPERHLHRSISAGLIEALIESRSDCSFVVLSHDLELAIGLSDRAGQAFSVLGVEWSGQDAVRWNLREVTKESPITESARRGILGGRRRVLFIEGTEGSLDFSLYRLLFPDWTIVPSGSCEWVIRSVEGVRSTKEHHWVQAVGIVDNDGRTNAEQQALIEKGVYTLQVSEVESLFFLPAVVDAVAAKQSATDGEDVTTRVDLAKSVGISALSENGGIERIAKKLATDELTRAIVTLVPDEVTDSVIQLNIPSPYAGIKAKLDDLIEASDFEGLIRVASIRDSAFRGKVARQLGFTNQERYQKAASIVILEDSALAAHLRDQISNELSSLPKES